jgi:hypothetical protein
MFNDRWETTSECACFWVYGKAWDGSELTNPTPHYTRWEGGRRCAPTGFGATRNPSLGLGLAPPSMNFVEAVKSKLAGVMATKALRWGGTAGCTSHNRCAGVRSVHRVRRGMQRGQECTQSEKGDAKGEKGMQRGPYRLGGDGVRGQMAQLRAGRGGGEDSPKERRAAQCRHSAG